MVAVKAGSFWIIGLCRSVCDDAGWCAIKFDRLKCVAGVFHAAYRREARCQFDVKRCAAGNFVFHGRRLHLTRCLQKCARLAAKAGLLLAMVTTQVTPRIFVVGIETIIRSRFPPRNSLPELFPFLAARSFPKP